MSTLFFAIRVFPFISLLLIGCRSSDSIVDKSTDPSQKAKNYGFTLSSCSTGQHTFTADSDAQVLQEYCTALQDDSLNQDCAEQQRAELFEKDHCAFALGLMDEASSGSEGGAQDSYVRPLQTTSNSVYQMIDIKSYNHSLSSLKSTMNFLWSTKSIGFQTRLPEEWIYESEMLIRDMQECGFDYYGPNCLEGQNKVLLHEGTFTSTDLHYAFFSFQYSESNKIFSLLLPLNDNYQFITENGKAFLFAVSNPDRAHDPQFIFAQNAALPIAEFSFTKLSQENIEQFNRKNELLRSQLRLAFYEQELKKLFNEPQKNNAIATSISDITAKLKTFHIEINTLNDNGDENAIFLYFKFFQERLSHKDYLEFLQQAREGKFKRLARQAELATIRQNHLDSEIMATLIQALGQDDQDLVRIAFWSLDFLSQIPSPLKSALARLLGDETEYIQEKTAAKLLKYKLDAPAIPKVAEVIGRKSNKPSTYKRALEVLASSPLIEVNQNIIALLEHRNKDLRRDLGLTLLSRTIEESLLPDLDNLVDSDYSENRFLGLSLINKLASPEATSSLLQKMFTIDANLRYYLLKLLKGRTNYANQHIAELLKFRPSRIPEIYETGLELILRIKTPEAADEILKLSGWLATMNEKKEEQRVVDTIKRLYDFTFSPLNIEALKLYSGTNSRKFDAAIDFLISIDSDHSSDRDSDHDRDQISSALINFVIQVNEIQRDKIFRYLDAGTLGGDCLTKMTDFLKYKPNPLYPQQQINHDKAIELIDRHDHIGAQKALATAMGMGEAEVRSWAISRLESIKLDSSIGDIFAHYLTGEVVWGENDNAKIVGISRYSDTIAAAKKFLLSTKSAEGFTQIMKALWLNDTDRGGNILVTAKQRDVFASLMTEYFRSLSSPSDVPDTLIEEINTAILKYGNMYGRVLIVKLLPLIPRCDLLKNLKQALTAEKINKDLAAAINEVIPEMEYRLENQCFPENNINIP